MSYETKTTVDKCSALEPLGTAAPSDIAELKSQIGVNYEESLRRQQSRLLDDLFSYHAPTPEQTPRYRAIRSAARHFAEIILDNAPPSSDQAKALDMVRMAMMLANAAIATNGRS